MQYYKILVLSCSGMGKLMHKSGDKVAENQIKEADVQRYLNGNYMEKCEAPKGAETAAPKKPTRAELAVRYKELSGEDAKKMTVSVLTEKIAELEAEKVQEFEDLKVKYLELSKEETVPDDWDVNRLISEIGALEAE